ncbi:MAG: cell division protein ZapA [Tannerella sp.]|jgi:cell division protein ZapA (FtsZ GTPase activity inhibitor)|nr:cell division protein ZapA [Tannerella sp.]
MPDEIPIQLEVIPGGGKYLVKAHPDEEELIREATKQLREKFNAYKQTFSEVNLSDEDILVMMAIDIATSHLKLEKKNDTIPFTTKIKQLNDELKDFLKEE